MDTLSCHKTTSCLSHGWWHCQIDRKRLSLPHTGLVSMGTSLFIGMAVAGWQAKSRFTKYSRQNRHDIIIMSTAVDLLLGVGLGIKTPSLSVLWLIVSVVISPVFVISSFHRFPCLLLFHLLTQKFYENSVTNNQYDTWNISGPVLFCSLFVVWVAYLLVLYRVYLNVEICDIQSKASVTWWMSVGLPGN